MQDLTPVLSREIMTLVPLVVLALWIGLYPKPFFDVLEEPVDRLVAQINKEHVYPDRIVQLNPDAFEPKPLQASLED